MNISFSSESSGIASPTLRDSAKLLLPVDLTLAATKGSDEWRVVGGPSEAISIGQGRTRPRARSLVDEPAKREMMEAEAKLSQSPSEEQPEPSLSNSLPHRASFDWGRQAFSPFGDELMISRMSSQSDLDKGTLALHKVAGGQAKGEGIASSDSLESLDFSGFSSPPPVPVAAATAASPVKSASSLECPLDDDSGASSTPQLPVMLHAELGFADEAEATELFKRSSMGTLIEEADQSNFINNLRRPCKSMAQTPGPNQPKGDLAMASLLESLDLGTLRSPALLFSPFPAGSEADETIAAYDGAKVRRHSAAAPAWLTPQQLVGNSLWSKDLEEDSAVQTASTPRPPPPYRRNNGSRRHSMAEVMPPSPIPNLPAHTSPPPSSSSSSMLLPRPPPNFYSPVIPDDELDEMNDDYDMDYGNSSHHYGGTPYHSYTPAMADQASFQLSTYQGPVYAVEFKAGRAELFYVAEREGGKPQFNVKVGDLVIVEADRGEDLGKITAEISMTRLRQLMASSDKAEELAKIMRPESAEEGERNLGRISPELANLLSSKEIAPKRIHRLAQSADLKLLQAKAQEEALAMVRCQSRVRQKKLPMEVVDAEYQWDRNKLTFYFCADRRIDFRELVRDLFRIYKTRIWMCAVDKNSPRMQTYLRDSPSLNAVLSHSSSMSTPYGRPT